MKISIIVPVYNVENYVEQCLRSICNQTINDIEIIIVNDGSEDNSISKIKEIKDYRIKIINQKNKGLSSARNTGLKYAIGDYIAFVDSDDFVGINTAYEDMYNIALKDNSDVVSGDAVWYYSESDRRIKEKSKNFIYDTPINGEEFLLTVLRANAIYVPVWFNLYKRDFLINNNLLFKEGVYHEDEWFTHRVLLKAERISIYNKQFYMYRQQRPGSITNTLSEKRYLDIIQSCFENEKQLININNYELKMRFKDRIAIRAMLDIYNHKVKEVPNEVKNMISRNAISKSTRIRSNILNLNTSLYIKSETIYRKLRKIKE